MYRITKMFGFTLIEILITIAFLSIMLSIAIPSYKQFVVDSRLRQAEGNMNLAIALARNESIRRGLQVNLTAIGGNWQNGWNVEQTDMTLIKTFEPLTNLTMTNFNQISFFPSGIRTDANTPQFTLKICDDSGVGKQLTVNVTGGITPIEIETSCAI